MTGTYLYYILSVLLTGVLLLSLLRKDEVSAYDERQEISRGKAFRAAFFCSLALCSFYSLLASMGNLLNHMHLSLVLQSIFWIPLTLFTCITVLSGAYFRRKNNASMIFSPLCLFLCNSFAFVRNAWNGEVIRDGVLTEECILLLFALNGFFTLICLLISYRKNKREEEDA